jgi:ADP-ribosylglycohydrolase
MLNKYKGCLLGLAVGDALGAPVEFMSFVEIKNKYGEEGIQDFDSWGGYRAGYYTDDTQMALATARGCIKASEKWKSDGVFEHTPYVYREYLKWLETQNDPSQRRAPGNTCLSALNSGIMGTIENPINESKGCGGVMRTAPVGLVFGRDVAFLEGARFAAMTHGHPSGYLSAGSLAELISWILEEKELKEAIAECKKTLVLYEDYEETLKKVELADRLSSDSIQVQDAIAAIGEGWVGEEALGIAIYCALKFDDDFKGGVIAAVNHSGDSDSTGSITGAILGTLLGVKAIPTSWLESLENAEDIENIASEMFRIFKEQPSEWLHEKD